MTHEIVKEEETWEPITNYSLIMFGQKPNGGVVIDTIASGRYLGDITEHWQACYIDSPDMYRAVLSQYVCVHFRILGISEGFTDAIESVTWTRPKIAVRKIKPIKHDLPKAPKPVQTSGSTSQYFTQMYATPPHINWGSPVSSGS